MDRLGCLHGCTRAPLSGLILWLHRPPRASRPAGSGSRRAPGAGRRGLRRSTAGQGGAVEHAGATVVASDLAGGSGRGPWTADPGRRRG
nr:unnamed protein product [Digitaria exilis]